MFGDAWSTFITTRSPLSSVALWSDNASVPISRRAGGFASGGGAPVGFATGAGGAVVVADVSAGGAAGTGAGTGAGAGATEGAGFTLLGAALELSANALPS